MNSLLAVVDHVGRMRLYFTALTSYANKGAHLLAILSFFFIRPASREATSSQTFVGMHFLFSNRPFLNGRQCCIAREHVVKVHISFRFFIFSNECIYFQIDGVEL